MKYELYKLKNGLQVLLQQDSSVDNVSVEFWLKTGIRDEEPNKYGFAHFFEHVTPYGLRGKTKELEQFRTYRTDSNAQVQKDFTRYYIKVKPEGLDLALQYTAERLNAKDIDIDNEKVESERIRVLSEIDRNSKNPFWSAEGTMALYSATFGQTHPYGHGGYGTIENNKNFKLEDFRQWYKKYVHPNNIILFVVGNFDETNARKYIDKHFGKLDGTTKNLNKTTMPPVNQNRKDFMVETNTEEHYLALSWAVSKWGSNEDGAFRILANILDDRLKDKSKQIKEISKIGIADLLNMYQYAGQFGVYASFSSLKDKEAIESFLEKEIKNLIEFGVTEVELKNAKQREIQKIQEMKKNLGFQSSRTELLGQSLLFRGNPDYYFTRLKKQSKLKKEEVEKTARIWLRKEPSKVLFKSKNN
ncbi:MAG TPA: pitrilysin family protein [Pyrinomonadaceae bacterium]